MPLVPPLEQLDLVVNFLTGDPEVIPKLIVLFDVAAESIEFTTTPEDVLKSTPL